MFIFYNGSNYYILHSLKTSENVNHLFQPLSKNTKEVK